MEMNADRKWGIKVYLQLNSGISKYYPNKRDICILGIGILMFFWLFFPQIYTVILGKTLELGAGQNPGGMVQGALVSSWSDPGLHITFRAGSYHNAKIKAYVLL